MFGKLFRKLFPKKPAPVKAPIIFPDIIEKQIDAIIQSTLSRFPYLVRYNPDVAFWQRIFKAMAYAESSFNPYSRYVEKGIKTKDQVTGGPNVSEGLFQLSQQDYKLHGAPFNWNVDKHLSENDPSKTIFDVKNNTLAAMIILDKQLSKGISLYTSAAPYYWAVLDKSRPGHKTFLAKLASYEQAPKESAPAPVPNPVPTPAPVTNTGSKIKNVAIIIGHGAGDSGAVGHSTNEFAYNTKVSKIIQDSAEHGKKITLFWRDSRGLAGVNSDVQKFNDDLSIELHLNSFNGVAKGCEILTLANDKVSILLAQDLADDFCKKFNRVKRDGDGVKELKKGERGHYSMALVNDPAPSILVEPFFIDNPAEWIEPEVYAAFLIDWLKSV